MWARRLFAVAVVVATTAACSSGRPAPPAPASTVAVAACAPAQLSLRYESGGPSLGFDFGTIRVRDVGTAPCRPRGPVSVTGTRASGRAVTRSVSVRVAAGLRLRGGGAPGLILLAAEYRDDPRGPDGLCVQARVVPYAWKVRIDGATFTVRNADPDDPDVPSGFRSLVTCRGTIAVWNALGPKL